jgi:hypothetical protein
VGAGNVQFDVQCIPFASECARRAVGTNGEELEVDVRARDELVVLPMRPTAKRCAVGDESAVNRFGVIPDRFAVVAGVTAAVLFDLVGAGVPPSSPELQPTA